MDLPRYPYHQTLEQRSGQPQRRPVVIVGAGPVGLTLALDLAKRDVPVVVIDDSDRIGEGSRAVCWAKKTLEVFDRLGVGEAVAREGVRWQRGRVFHGECEAYAFDLLPESHHKMPAMVNLQQDQVEARLVRAAQLDGRIELRGRHELIGLEQDAEDPSQGVTLTVRTPDGLFDMRADWVVGCDGARSPTRTLLGLSFTGQVFEDRFLIADVRLGAGVRPRGLDPARPERWFWFDPPFHRGQSVLLHAQADGLWRIDFQLGRNADVEAERNVDRIKARVAQMLDTEGFELVWSSIYQFCCRRASAFRVGRVLLAGDAAHQVSPFGARGANSGVQDADNLGWKLAAVVKGEGGRDGLALLDSYEAERIAAADDNIGHSTRATDFISPKSALSLRFRRAALDLAAHAEFAKPLVNSGAAVHAHRHGRLRVEHARRGCLGRRARARLPRARRAAGKAAGSANNGMASSRCWPLAMQWTSMAACWCCRPTASRRSAMPRSPAASTWSGRTLSSRRAGGVSMLLPSAPRWPAPYGRPHE